MSGAEYNQLQWEPLTIEQLNELTKGATVTEAEEIGAPLLEGIGLTIRTAAGQDMIINIISNEQDQEAETYLEIEAANVGAERRPKHGLY